MNLVPLDFLNGVGNFWMGMAPVEFDKPNNMEKGAPPMPHPWLKFTYFDQVVNFGIMKLNPQSPLWPIEIDVSNHSSNDTLSGVINVCGLYGQWNATEHRIVFDIIQECQHPHNRYW